MVFLLHETHDPQAFRQLLARLVGSIAGGERLEDIGNRHDPCLYRHFLAAQTARVAGAIHFFVMTARILGYVLQVLRKRQRFEHLDGRDDVIVDDLALLVIEGATLDTQVHRFIVGNQRPAVAAGVDPLQLCQPLYALDVFIAHEFAADIGLT